MLDIPTSFTHGCTCLVRQPRYMSSMTKIDEIIFLGRVYMEDGEFVGFTRLGPIPDDDTSTITGDGDLINLPTHMGLQIFEDTPAHRRLLRAIQAKEQQAAALELALTTVAAVEPGKLNAPLRQVLQTAGRLQ